MSNLPTATIERIIRSAGIPRVSNDATALIIPEVEKFIKDLATKAYGYTTHAGRNTLKDIDVEAALGLVRAT
jgi:DNA-binding protein